MVNLRKSKTDQLVSEDNYKDIHCENEWENSLTYFYSLYNVWKRERSERHQNIKNWWDGVLLLYIVETGESVNSSVWCIVIETCFLRGRESTDDFTEWKRLP